MAILPSRVAGSIGVANCMPTPKRPALCSPFAGTVDATAGRPTVVNDEVRSSEVSPPRAPRSPFSTDTTYLDDSPSRTVGLKVATVTSSFQLIRPGTAAPVRSRTAMPPAAERSIDWLKAMATSWFGLANCVFSSGVIDATAGVTVLNDQRKSSASAPSAAEARPFATPRRYVAFGSRSLGMKR